MRRLWSGAAASPPAAIAAAILFVSCAVGSAAAPAKKTARKPVPAKKTARKPAPVPPAAASWRGCAGIEDGVLATTPAVLRSGSAAPGSPVTASLQAPAALRGCGVAVVPITEAGRPERLLVRLKPAAGARPGRYRVTLSVRRATATAKLPLSVEVLPFSLMRPSKQYSLSRVPFGTADTCAPEEADPARLRPLRDLGFGSLCLQALPEDRAPLESAMRAAGLRGPVLVTMETPDAGAPRSETLTPSGPRPLGLGPIIRWYALLPQSPGVDGALAALKQDGLMVACHMTGEEIAPQGGGVDLPIFTAGSPHDARLFARPGPLAASTIGWWRWDAGEASDLENRFRCGAGLWKSGLSGALVEIGPERVGDSGWPLRWEGIRQGVLDSRYMTTLFALARQMKDKDRGSALPAAAEEAVAAALNGLVRQPTPAAAHRFREVLIAWNIRLHRALGA